MPIIDKNTLDSHSIAGSGYGFSATRIGSLGASEFTLAVLGADTSGSVLGFLPEIESCIQNVVLACTHSPRADNLMLRVTRFDSRLEEVHGFKPLPECSPGDYRGCLKPGGTTALYDAVYNAVESISSYGQSLSENDFGVNGIVFVVTDGMDNASAMTAKSVRKALRRAVTSERLESLVSVLIGVNTESSGISSYLSDFSREAGFTQYIELGKADEKGLARLSDFVSRSISVQSRALGSGGPSRTLRF
jgi:hypothetical protein